VEKRKIQSRVRKKNQERKGDGRKNKGRVGVFSGEKRGVFLGGEWGNSKERGRVKRKEEREVSWRKVSGERESGEGSRGEELRVEGERKEEGEEEGEGKREQGGEREWRGKE
jgi:hypothetical protein